MSTSAKPKAKRRPKLAALFLLGSDGELYCCAPVANLPEDIQRNPNAVIAIRLSRRERDVALDSLQEGVQATARLLGGIVGRRGFDA